MSLRKVQSGQSLKRFPSAAFNAFVDAAEDFQSRQMQRSQEKIPSVRSAGIVLIHNDSGTDVDAGGVLGITVAKAKTATSVTSPNIGDNTMPPNWCDIDDQKGWYVDPFGTSGIHAAIRWDFDYA